MFNLWLWPMLAVITDSGFPGEVLAQFQRREIIGTIIEQLN